MTARLAVTLGDPRGVGPEVTARAAEKLLRQDPRVELTFLGDPVGFDMPGAVEAPTAFSGSLESAGAISGGAIEAAVRGALAGRFDAIVTAPIHKPALRAAGYTEPGHTELLQRLTEAPDVGMLMAAETTAGGTPLRVLLATTHHALRDVPDLLTADLLERQVRLLLRSLHREWGIERPSIGLCAFNPHAGDGGLFGDEEERIYAPALAALQADGLEVHGPVPADTVFSRALRGEFDAVVAPYHDVGMAAFKTVSFGRGVNVTLGLPFPRTSPDHGTAFDLAGQGTADPGSMLEAMTLALRLAGNHRGSGL